MPTQSDDRRRRNRISAMILCEICVRDQPPELVRVRDLTHSGIKIATGRQLPVGDRLRVRMPGRLDWSLARVAWCANGVAGLSFGRAIELPVVAGARMIEDIAAPPYLDSPRRMAS